MRRLLIGLFSLLLVGATVQAQDVIETPFLALLATIPDTPVSRTELLYNDRAAIATAYPSAQMPTSYAELEATLRSDDEDSPVSLWFTIFSNTSTARLAVYMSLGDEMADAVGFDFFAIQQELHYGLPPEQAISLTGAFDLDQVREIISAAGYSPIATLVGEVWCPEAGCDSGAMMNMEARNPANPFGGDLGRQFPLFIHDTQIIGSPAEAVVDAHAAVAADDQPSLADAPDYAAAAAAISSGGTLMQAAFYPPEALQSGAEVADGLPPYLLAAFGDVATEDAQQVRVALAYESAEDAVRAAELLPSLLELPSERAQRPWSDILKEASVTDVRSEVIESDGAVSIVLLTLSGERGSAEAILSYRAETADFAMPGRLFRTLMTALNNRDLVWLQSGE